MKVRFNSKFAKLTVVTCYAPTEEAADADKEDFYKQLQSIIEKIPAHDMLLIIGDLKCKDRNRQYKQRGHYLKRGTWNLSNEQCCLINM